LARAGPPGAERAALLSPQCGSLSISPASFLSGDVMVMGRHGKLGPDCASLDPMRDLPPKALDPQDFPLWRLPA